MGKDFKKDADAPTPPTPSSGQIPLSKAIFFAWRTTGFLDFRIRESKNVADVGRKCVFGDDVENVIT